MIIDLRRTAIKRRLDGLFTAFVFTAIILSFLLLEIFDKPVLGISKGYFVLFFSIVYLLLLVYNYLRDYNYIYFNDEGKKIIFRYYSMHPLSQAKRSIEINKGSLVKFEIQTGLFGIKSKIILYQKVKTGVYKFPAVSITALTKEERAKLLSALNGLI